MGIDVLLELNDNTKNYIEDLGKFRPVLKGVINIRTWTCVLDIGSPLENLTQAPFVYTKLTSRNFERHTLLASSQPTEKRRFPKQRESQITSHVLRGTVKWPKDLWHQILSMSLKESLNVKWEAGREAPEQAPQGRPLAPSPLPPAMPSAFESFYWCGRLCFLIWLLIQDLVLAGFLKTLSVMP